MKIFAILIQTAFLILIAPLMSGIIRKIKNNLRMRRGASIFQPYYNFFKLMSKEEVISENASWIFSFTPYIVLSSTIAALLLVPAVISGWSFNILGDFLLIIFLFSLGRFFIALAGLEAGSSFGGMGSSREMFISSLVEPVALLAVFAVSVKGGSTDLQSVFAGQSMQVSSIIAAAALLFVTIAETSRLPVDNQETHLELTMVHEAMVLEYSGRSLALIELAGHIKQIIFFTIIANIILPMNFWSFSGYLVKILFLCVIVAVVEVSTAKVRLFRIVDFLAFGFVLSSIAVTLSLMGY